MTRLSSGLAAAMLAFGLCNLTITLLRDAKPEWLAVAWMGLFFGWGLMCLCSLKWAFLLLLGSLPFFGARPGDLITNAQDTCILIAAAVSLWRFPLQWGRRPSLWPAWLLSAVGFLSLWANVSRCFHPWWPVHQDNWTRNLFFMFSESWDWTIGLSEWWMLVMMLLAARGLAHLLETEAISIKAIGAALTAGLLAALIVGFAEYYSRPAHELITRIQLRLYDFSQEVAPHGAIPSFLLSRSDPGLSMKSFFGNRGWFSLYLLAVLPVACGTVGALRGAPLRWCVVPLALSGSLAILLSGARTGLIAGAAGLVLLGLLLILKRSSLGAILARRFSTWLVLVLMLASVGATWWLWGRPNRIDQTIDPMYRDVAWRKVLTLVQDNPLLGVGYESFGLAAREIPPKLHDFEHITTHNFCTQVWVCTGPLGALALLLLLAIPVRVLLRFVSGQNRIEPVVVAVAFSFALIFISGQAQHWWYQRSTALFWWLGLAVLESQRQRRLARATLPSSGGSGSEPHETSE